MFLFRQSVELQNIKNSQTLKKTLKHLFFYLKVCYDYLSIFNVSVYFYIYKHIWKLDRYVA